MGFLTILPVGSAKRADGRGLSSARAWFPAVGLLLGTALAAIDLLLRRLYAAGPSNGADVPVAAPFLTGAVLVVALVAMTRALHLDGFMDTCDALLGGSSPEGRRRILKDPRVGSFAVAGVVCLLLLKLVAVERRLFGNRIADELLNPGGCRMRHSQGPFAWMRPPSR